MNKKAKVAVTSITGFIFFVVLVFMIVSLSLASAHDKSLIDEWKSWGGNEIVETEEEQDKEETVQDEITEIEDYSNIEIIA